MAKHEYPAGWKPGAHWASDMAWEALDILEPGHLSVAARELLAGVVTAKIIMAHHKGRKDERAALTGA